NLRDGDGREHLRIADAREPGVERAERRRHVGLAGWGRGLGGHRVEAVPERQPYRRRVLPETHAEGPAEAVRPVVRLGAVLVGDDRVAALPALPDPQAGLV